jgi:hypothetical protein
VHPRPGLVGVGDPGRAQGRLDGLRAGLVPDGRELGLAAAAGLGAGEQGRRAAGPEREQQAAGDDAPARACGVAAERAQQVVHVGPALSWLSGQAAKDGALQEQGDLAGAGRLVDAALEHVLGELQHRAPGEGELTVEGLVERGAEGELVGAGVGDEAEVLLAGHVRGRAEDGAVAGEGGREGARDLELVHRGP